MYQFLCIFFVYAFLGWCTEVAYAALVTGKFVNRGFLNGPVCPIYGFGVVLVLSLLEPLKGSMPLLFLGSVLLTSMLELVTGFVLEKAFHQHWWDYSQEPFNLGGYICLRFSIAWGLACMFVVYLIHPSVLLMIRLVPHTLGVVLLVLFCAVTAVDLAATVSTIVKLNRRLSQIDELAGKIRDMSNEFGENLADRVLDAAARGEDWKEELEDRAADWREDVQELKEGWQQKRQELRQDLAQRRRELEKLRLKLDEALDSKFSGQDRLLRAFPRMRSVHHRGALEELQKRFGRR